jgi:hypothetical protein
VPDPAAEVDVERDAGIARAAAEAWLAARLTSQPAPSPEELRAQWEREMRRERGEAWWREHEHYMDGWWEILVARGLV